MVSARDIQITSKFKNSLAKEQMVADWQVEQFVFGSEINIYFLFD